MEGHRPMSPVFNPGWFSTDHRITPGEPLDLVIENRIPLDLPPLYR